MVYDFDKIIDRTGTGAYAIENLPSYFGHADLLPMWVADMHFETPSFIIDALKRRLEHPVLGYTLLPENYWDVVAEWIHSHHDWQVKKEWMTFIPGIVRGIGYVINYLLKEGDKVIIQTPVYHPFRLVPQKNGFEVVNNPLKENANGSYAMDFENLERVCDDKCKLLILSNPHNPVGIVWDKNTLTKLASFAKSHGLIIISDEIHCDMALWGNKHIPFASVSEEAAECSITFGAPSKTFNMAGVVSSYAIVPNENLRKGFYGWLHANELCAAPMFSPIATLAAFENGEEWRQQMLKYVEDNIRWIEDFCKCNLPQVKPLRPQASFLIWLDCRELGLSQDELLSLFIEKAKVACNDGEMFGSEGIGFMRLNVGCSRVMVEKALTQLKNAWDTLMAQRC